MREGCLRFWVFVLFVAEELVLGEEGPMGLGAHCPEQRNVNNACLAQLCMVFTNSIWDGDKHFKENLLKGLFTGVAKLGRDTRASDCEWI
jgi:hypothetical protein